MTPVEKKILSSIGVDTVNLYIKITRNSEVALDEISESRNAHYDEVIEPSDSEQFIHNNMRRIHAKLFDGKQSINLYKWD